MLTRTVTGMVAAGVAMVCFLQASLARPIQAGDRLLLDFGYNYVGTVDGSGRTWNSNLKPTPGTTTSNLLTAEGVATNVAIWWGGRTLFSEV
jgi:hypothetical protein